jgi:photosystem II stability/assembly factor-like uncharacterized protein
MLEKGFVLAYRSLRNNPSKILLLAIQFGIAFSALSIPAAAVARETGALQDHWQELLEKVDRAELERIVRDLSGANVIYIGEIPVVLETRHALSPLKEFACHYLLDEIEACGYEPVVQSFLLNVQRPNLTAVEISVGGDTIWVGDISKGSIYRATAGGGWSSYENIGSADVKINDLELDGRGRLWAACGLWGGGRGAIYRSTDGGGTWVSVYSGDEIWSFYDMTLEGDEYGIAAGSYGTVAVASGGGASWSSLNPGIFNYRHVYGSAASGEMHFWLVDAGGSLYETTDAGATWSEYAIAATRLFAIDFWDARRGVIVGDGTSFHTADSGRTWTEVPVAAELRHVSMADSLLVLAGGSMGEVFFSTDGGANWVDATDICGSDQIVSRTVASGADRFWLVGGNEVRRFDFGEPPQCAHYELADSIMGSNISFLHEGSESPGQRIILCAHYDSYTSTPDECAPGADDNATGVAAVLEAARALEGAWTEKSIEFVLFDGEELGLLGSRYFAGALPADSVYEAVVNLDMLGYDNLSDRSLVIAGRDTDENASDSVLADYIIGTAADLVPGMYPYFAPGELLSSDHRSFWDMGIPSVLLIEGKRVELTPRYHTCYDVASAIDYEYLEGCAKVALAAVAGLAGYAVADPNAVVYPTARIHRNWPNPFSESTRISYFLPVSTSARLSVYDVSGREVARLFSEVVADGLHEFEWNGRDRLGNRVASGVYFLRLESGGAGNDVRKIVLIR